MKQAETAVIEWQAANVGPIQVNLSASVKRGIMGKAYSMNVQVSFWWGDNSTSYLLP